MRKINGKLFLALLLGTVLLGGGVFAVHHFQYQQIAQAVLWQARHAEEKGEVPRQVKYIDRYLEFNPHDLDEKIKLAQLLASETYATSPKSRGRAVRLLDDVILYRDDPELRKLLVKVALEPQVNDLKLARDHLSRLMAWEVMQPRLEQLRTARTNQEALPGELAGVDSETGELEGYWGQLLEAENKPAEAMNCYRLAILHAPQSEINPSRLAFLLRRDNTTDAAVRQANQQEADAVIEQLVQRNPNSAEAHLSCWRYRRTFDLLDIRESGQPGNISLGKAARDVEKALKLKPEGVEVLLAGAELERLQGRVALEDGRNKPEERVAKFQKHRAQAEEYLTRGLEVVAKQGKGPATEMQRFQLLWHKANLLLDDLDRLDGNPDLPAPTSEGLASLKGKINELIEQVRKTPVSAAGEYLQGRLLVHERRWADAATLFEQAQKLLAPQPDLAAQADLYLGQCYERLEEHQQMYDAYRRVLDREPTSVAAQLGMAMARWAQGRYNDALEQYQLIMSQKRVPARGWFDVARLEIQRQAQADKPEWKRAEEAVERAEKTNPGMLTEAAMLRTELLVRQNKIEQAKEVLRKYHTARPTDAEFFATLADLEIHERHFDEAGKVLNEGKEKAGDKVTLRLARARLFLARADKSTAEEVKALAEALKELAQQCEQFIEDDQARLLKGLGESLLLIGANADARALLKQMADLPRQKGNLRLRLVLFDLALKAGDRDGMDECLEEIRSVEQSSGTFYRYGKALQLIWLARNDKSGKAAGLLTDARAQLDQVQAQRPTWAPLFLARAEISEMNGNPEQTIADLQAALEQGEGSTAVVLRLVKLLRARHQSDKAELVLKTHQKAVQSSIELNRIQVGLALERKQVQEALKLAQKLVREDSNNPEELMWMGDVYQAAKQPAQAEKKYDAAIRLAGSNPVPWLKKVGFLVEQKRKDEARKVMEQMSKKVAPPEVPVALGGCYVLLGQWDEAEKAYEEALQARRTNPEVVRRVAQYYSTTGKLAKAEPLLREIIKGDEVKSSPADRTWAERELADVLVRGGDHQKQAEAMTLVGLKLDADGRLSSEETSVEENIERRRAQSKVLARQPEKRFRQRAIEILEGMRPDRALEEDDQHRLALLYLSEGQPHKARREFEELVERTKIRPQYLADYAALLLGQRKLPAAPLDTVEEGLLRKLIGRLKELEKLYELDANAFGRIELEARVMEASEEGDKALQMLREYAQRKDAKPEDVFLELASLTRQKRTAEAFNLVNRIWKEGKVKPEVIGGVSVGLVNVLKLNDAQMKTLESHLNRAIGDDNKSVLLRMHLADLHGKSGRYDDAQKVYREVLEREPTNPVALNNLAWLLATRARDANDAQEALRHISKAVEGRGRRVELLDTRGVVYLALNDAEKALSDLKEATAEAATPTRLFHLARAHHLNHDRNKAARVLTEAALKAKGKEELLAQIHPTEKKVCQQLLGEYPEVQ
jgi:tetratricopeptide (TPR) repeat protein